MQTKSHFPQFKQNTAMLGIAASVLMAIIAVCYAQWRRYDRANREAALTSDAVDSVSRLFSDLLDAESAQRGFVLTGENRFLQPYDQAVQEIPRELRTVRGLVAVRQGESGIIAQLNQLVEQRLAEFRRRIDVRRTQGAAVAAAVVLTNEAQQTMQQIRSVCDEIQRRERSAQRQASLDGEAAAQIALLITVAGSLILLFFFAIGFEPFLTRGSGPRDRRWFLRYGAAVVTVTAATLLRMALVPLVGSGTNSIPFVIFFPAILFAAWYGGFRAGTLALLLSTFASDYFFLAPEGKFDIRGPDELISLLIFVTVGFGIAFMSDSQRRAVARAEIAEDAERHERQRFETTLASIGDAVIATDAEGRVTFANKVALHLAAWSETEIAGQHLDEVFRIVNEYSRQKVESPVARVLREGAIVGLANHTVLLARDGTEVPIDDSAAPIRNRSGAIQGTVLVFRDITERRRAEAARNLLSSMVESSGDAIFSNDLNGIVTSWNQAAERIFGYSAGEMIGKPISLLNPPGEPDDTAQILEQIRRGERIEQHQTLRRTRDHNVIHASVTISPIYDASGAVTGASRITRDITAEVQAKEDLAEERERLRVTLNSIGDAVITTDHHGRVTYLNPVAENLTGWPGRDAAGKPLDEIFRIVGEETREVVENPALRVLKERRMVGLANHTVLIASNGCESAIDDSAAPIRNSRGEIIGVVLIFRDITERRASEKQLLAQTSELRRANEELSQFAYVVSHDLREPLRTVVNFSELLVREQAIAPGSDAATYAKFILDSVHRMEVLLNDLLAYSQLGGPHEQPHCRIDMNRIVEEVRRNLEAMIAETGAEVVAGDLPEVFGYETQLLEVLQNLISNAIKYRSDRPPRIQISAWREESDWVFSVRDNGIGIAPEYRQMIFGVFKRLHGREVPGTGIGLAICSKVVERHGGKIWVESEPGEGAEFFFTMPVNLAGRAASSQS